MKNFIIILYLAINVFIVNGQSKEEINNLIKSSRPEVKEKYRFARSYKNEVDFIFSNLFLFYKKFISPHDVSNCSFTPTCSEYALKAIKSQGVFKGSINFFDRFSRCNGINQSDYKIDIGKKLLIDPVRNIKYEVVETE